MSRYTLGPEVLSSNASLEDVPRVRLHLAKHPFLMRVISVGAVLNCCGAVGEDVPLPPPPNTSEPFSVSTSDKMRWGGERMADQGARASA